MYAHRMFLKDGHAHQLAVLMTWPHSFSLCYGKHFHWAFPSPAAQQILHECEWQHCVSSSGRRVGSDSVVGIALRTRAQGSACTLLTMSRTRWRRVIDESQWGMRVVRWLTEDTNVGIETHWDNVGVQEYTASAVSASSPIDLLIACSVPSKLVTLKRQQASTLSLTQNNACRIEICHAY